MKSINYEKCAAIPRVIIRTEGSKITIVAAQMTKSSLQRIQKQ